MMKKNTIIVKRLSVIVLCLLFCVIMCACSIGKSSSNFLVGRWICNGNHSLTYGDKEFYEFFNDGTYAYGHYNSKRQDYHNVNGGKWSILEDGRLKLEVGYKVFTYDINKNSNTIAIDYCQYTKQ